MFIKLHLGWYKHPKIVKLKRRLGADGVLSLLHLWTFCGESRQNGSLVSMSEEDLEIAADWMGDAGKFVSTLRELQLLDLDNKIHNWDRHNDFVADAPKRTAKAKNAALARWSKKESIPSQPIHHIKSYPMESTDVQAYATPENAPVEKKTKEIAVPRYMQPDRAGNPRKRVGDYRHLHLSQPELDKFRAACDERGLTKEQRSLIGDKVDNWFDENPKKLAKSSDHITRLMTWGLKDALELDTSAAKHTRAKDIAKASLLGDSKAVREEKRIHALIDNLKKEENECTGSRNITRISPLDLAISASGRRYS